MGTENLQDKKIFNKLGDFSHKAESDDEQKRGGKVSAATSPCGGRVAMAHASLGSRLGREDPFFFFPVFSLCLFQHPPNACWLAVANGDYSLAQGATLGRGCVGSYF